MAKAAPPRPARRVAAPQPALVAGRHPGGVPRRARFGVPVHVACRHPTGGEGDPHHLPRRGHPGDRPERRADRPRRRFAGRLGRTGKRVGSARRAVVDLPDGSLVVEGTTGRPEVPTAYTRVGLRLAPGRLPVTTPQGRPEGAHRGAAGTRGRGQGRATGVVGRRHDGGYADARGRRIDAGRCHRACRACGGHRAPGGVRSHRAGQQAER